MAGVVLAAAAAGMFFLNGSDRVAAPAPAVMPAAAATPARLTAGESRGQTAAAAPASAAASAPAQPAGIAGVDAPPAPPAAAAAVLTTPAVAASQPAAVHAATTRPSATAAATRPATSLPVAKRPASAAAAFAEAKASLAAGEPVAARRVLNAALAAGMLSDSEAAEAKRQMGEINKLLVFSPRRFAGDECVVPHKVEPGEMLAKIASASDLTYRFVQRINGLDDPRKLRAGATIKLLKGPFHAVVTKHAFTMDLYLGAPGGEGSMYVTSYRVGLGSDDSTPTGKWLVEPGRKATNPRWIDPRSGRVYEPDDPENPLGEYWIGLLGTEGESVGQASYGIHATIDPDTIGKQASLGCIRLRSEDVAQVFDMLVEGKSIVVVLP